MKPIERILEIHPHAAVALAAAENWKKWGPVAAVRFAVKRGCPLGLVRTARQLKAVERFDFSTVMKEVYHG